MQRTERDRETRALQVSKAEAREIDFTPAGIETDEEVQQEGEAFEAMLRVYSPVYDLKASHWRFWYGKEHLYMDVSESNIREVVLRHGGALVDDWFRVMVQIDGDESADGKKSQSYKVLDVLEFIPAFRQRDMLADEEKNDNPQEGPGDGGA